MATRTVTIGSPVGLHARPAAVFTRAVEDTGVNVRISKDGSVPQDAASILGVMTLAVEQGDRKSTRLNSSHVAISYAVFCLKKKKRIRRVNRERLIHSATRV